MENEIKVGDWIRDREGHITKIIQTLSLFKDVYLYLGEDGYQYSDNAIVKHSPNLINLIECGDYVNGIKIISITQQADTMKTISLCGFDNDYLDIKLNNRDIKTVVTKEQFKSISYKVKE